MVARKALAEEHGQPAFSAKGRVAMKKPTRLKFGPVALLVLLALLALLAVKRQHLTAEEAVDEGVREVVRVGDTVVRRKYAGVALLAVIGLLALLAFVTWTALRANEGEDKAPPPAGRGDSTPPSSQ
jgi:hypothetical protein